MSKSKSTHPHFITIEGGEGAGKTTLMNHLEKMLRESGLSVLRTREPGGTLFGDEIRKWLLSHNSEVKIGDKAELLLFLAARAQHIEEKIAPAIAADQVVICDRFNDSTVAYQGVARGLGKEWVRSLCDSICDKTVPDMTFYLDVDPTIGLERTRKAAKENASAGFVDRIEAEKLEFHKRVRDAFIEMAKKEPGRFHRIDANKSQDYVWKEVLGIVTSRFGLHAARAKP